MNFRDDWPVSILLNVAAALIIRLFVQPWLEPLIRAVRAACAGLYQRLRGRNKTVALTGLRMDLTLGSISASVSPPG
jgi:hypothetical protein